MIWIHVWEWTMEMLQTPKPDAPYIHTYIHPPPPPHTHTHTDVCSPGNPTHDDVRAWVMDGAATPFEITVQADKVYPDISSFLTQKKNSCENINF